MTNKECIWRDGYCDLHKSTHCSGKHGGWPDRTPKEKPTEDVEELSAILHAVYQEEAKRQGDVRHHDDYKDLPEHIQEFDRVLARLMITREKAAREALKKELLERISECRWKNVPINRPYGYLYDEAIADAENVIKGTK